MIIPRNLTTADIREALADQLPKGSSAVGAAEPIGRIVVDSRQVEPGDCFWALPGSRHDGADFVVDAFDRGAAGAVTAGKSGKPTDGQWLLRVRDAHEALWQLAAWNRGRYSGRVIAVTGSVGKTTTREMIHAALGGTATGTASPQNYNNHVGLPLSMCAIDGKYAVLELGASAAGEIRDLAELSRPHVGVITRAAAAHVAGFGGESKIAEAKAELLAAIDPAGLAVLNGDDEGLRRVARRSRAPICWIGRGADCDLSATQVEHGAGQLRFSVDGQRFAVPAWGRHHLTAALAAVAVGRAVGRTDADIAHGLTDFRQPPGRCSVQRCAGVTVIDDTYNANPAAFHTALGLLRELPTDARRVVVCGDMHELGAASDEHHARLGEEVVTYCGADLLLAAGRHARQTVAAAHAAGMPSRCAVACERVEDLTEHLAAIRAGDVVLVKGSRAAHMERVVAWLHSRLGEPAAVAA